MSHLMKLPVENYEEYWLDLDKIEIVALGTLVMQTPEGNKSGPGTILKLTSGQTVFFPTETFQQVLQEMLKNEGGAPKDIDIPDAWLKGWDDKEDDKEPA